MERHSGTVGLGPRKCFRGYYNQFWSGMSNHKNELKFHHFLDPKGYQLVIRDVRDIRLFNKIFIKLRFCRFVYLSIYIKSVNFIIMRLDTNVLKDERAYLKRIYGIYLYIYSNVYHRWLT